MSNKTPDAATPTSENDSNPALSPERILRVLDFEIDRISAEHSRPGWTVWALCGALAATIWLLIEQFTSANLHLVNSLQLFVALSALASVRHLLTALQGFGQTTTQRSPRFIWAGDSTNRVEILIDTVKSLSLALIALTITSGVRWYYCWIVILTYGLIALLGAVALVLSMFRIPVKRGSQRLEGRAQIAVGITVWILCLGVLGLIVFGFLSALSSSPQPTSVADVRAAALAVVAILLSKFLATSYLPPPLLMSLIETRRDIAFGRIELDTAIEQADIAILGMNEITVLQEDVRAILHLFELTDAELAKGEKILEKCLSAVNSKEVFWETVHGLIPELRASVPILKDAESRLEKQHRALDRRRRFLGDTPTSIAAFSEIMQRITEARNHSAERVQTFVSKAESVLSIMENEVKDLEDEGKRLEAEKNRLKDEVARLQALLPEGEAVASTTNGPADTD